MHDARQVKRLTIRPGPPHAKDRPLAQRHGKADRIVILGQLRPALAAGAAGCLCLLEARRPDHLTADPHPAVNGGHPRAFARFHHGQGFDTRPLLRRGEICAHRPPGQTAERLANRRARELPPKQGQPLRQGLLPDRLPDT